MPTISKETIGFEGARFLREIRIDSTGVFTIKTPELVAFAGFPSVVEDKTKDGAIAKFNAAIRDYKNSRTTVRRIVAYHFGASCYIWNGERCIMKREDMHFSKGTALELCAQVFDEHETEGKEGNLSYRYVPVESSIPRGLRFTQSYLGERARHKEQLPHSPEVEEFFAAIGRSMENLALRLHVGFSEPASVAKLVASGGFPALMS